MKYNCFPLAGEKHRCPFYIPHHTTAINPRKPHSQQKGEPVAAKRRQSNVASFPHCPGQIDEVIFWSFQMPGAIGHFNPVRHCPTRQFQSSIASCRVHIHWGMRWEAWYKSISSPSLVTCRFKPRIVTAVTLGSSGTCSVAAATSGTECG